MDDQVPKPAEKSKNPLSASNMFPKLSQSIDRELSQTKNKNTIFNWKVSPEDLEEQVAKYHDLPLAKSYRGIMALLYLAILALALILGYFGSVGWDIYSAIAQIIIFAPFVAFAYLGHRWALIVLALLETLNRALQLTDMINPLITLAWWAIFISAIYRAYQVEVERDKRLSVKEKGTTTINSRIL